MDLLRDPIAYVIAILAILVVILIAVMSRPKRRIFYQTLSVTPLLTAREELAGRLRVSFDRREVKDISIAIVQVFNGGNQAIASAEFEEPLTIAAVGNGRILSAEVIETVPKELVQDLAVTDRAVTFSPKLLNPGDVITTKLVVTGLTDGLTLRGRAVGVSELVNAHAGPIDQLWQSLFVVFGGAVGLGLGLVIVAAIATIEGIPETAIKVMALIAMIGGGALGFVLSNRVVVGPRRRSAEFRRAASEAAARSAEFRRAAREADARGRNRGR